MSTAGFQLHPQLANDTLVVGRFDLCLALLMNDANYPWVILVPRRDGLREIFELSGDEQTQFTGESSFVAKSMARHFHADKMNIAALGNVVPQLHIHHIARYTTDPAWPAPVWGKVARLSYTNHDARQALENLRGLFAARTDFTIDE